MDRLLKQAKLEFLTSSIEFRGITVGDLYDIVKNNMKNSIEKIKVQLPEAKLFDCHKLKATLLDLEKCGKIHELIEIDSPKQQKHEVEPYTGLVKKDYYENSDSKPKSSKREQETITPDKKGYGKCADQKYS